MPSNAEGGAAASNAEVATSNGDGRSRGYAPGSPEHQRHLDYLEQVADDADAAVEAAEQTLADLKESLADRKAVAKRARANLRTAQKQED